MKRSMLLAALCAALVLAMAPAVVAQTTDLYDCDDFQFREDAQAQLLAGDPYGLDDDNDGTACDDLPSRGTTEQPTAPGQYVPPTAPAPQVDQEDLDCADFVSRAEAQAVLDADPGDPYGLDADGDGVACEEDDTRTGTRVTPDGLQYSDLPDVVPTPTVGTATTLPATGGPSPALLAGALLVGAGLVLSRR